MRRAAVLEAVEPVKEAPAEVSCTECGRRPLHGERWSLPFADLGEVAVYGDGCDRREFSDGDSASAVRSSRSHMSSRVLALIFVGSAADKRVRPFRKQPAADNTRPLHQRVLLIRRSTCCMLLIPVPERLGSLQHYPSRERVPREALAANLRVLGGVSG